MRLLGRMAIVLLAIVGALSVVRYARSPSHVVIVPAEESVSPNNFKPFPTSLPMEQAEVSTYPLRPAPAPTAVVHSGVVLMPLLMASVVLIAIAVVMALILRKRGRGETTSSEAELIQDIHEGLLRMEHRIEALETLLVDSRVGGPARTP